MPNKLGPPPSQPMVYQIKLKGQLGDQWTDWFEGMTITLEGNGDTLLTGPVVDQAALHGLLKKVRDLGMPLLSVGPVETGPSSTQGTGRAEAAEVKPSSPNQCNSSISFKKGEKG